MSRDPKRLLDSSNTEAWDVERDLLATLKGSDPPAIAHSLAWHNLLAQVGPGLIGAKVIAELATTSVGAGSAATAATGSSASSLASGTTAFAPAASMTTTAAAAAPTAIGGAATAATLGSTQLVSWSVAAKFVAAIGIAGAGYASVAHLAGPDTAKPGSVETRPAGEGVARAPAAAVSQPSPETQPAPVEVDDLPLADSVPGNGPNRYSMKRGLVRPISPVMKPDSALEREEPEETQLQAENELLGLARGKLRNGDAPGSLRTLRELSARFPKGSLVQERQVLAIEAYAGMGNAKGADRAARAFLKAFPLSPHGDRVRRFVIAN